MNWDENNLQPMQAAIFKCENGFGIETVSEGEETMHIKRFVARSLPEAFALVESYFGEGSS